MKKDTENKFENQDFDLFEALNAIDKKDYDYYSRLSEEQKAKFSAYMMLIWLSYLRDNGEISKYYLLAGEEFANKHFFNEHIQNHPELQWKMLCTASPNVKRRITREWIPQLSLKIANLQIAATKKQAQDYFAKIYTTASSNDISEYSKEWTRVQNHKHRIADRYPGLKLSDIDVLSVLVSESDLDEYDRQSGC